ncbi:hypothetical protein GCM10009771_20590 [Nesterenkonia flava]
MTEAFHDYAWTRYVIPETGYETRLWKLQRLYLGHALRHGVVVVDESHDGVLAALPPDAPQPSTSFMERVVDLHGPSVWRMSTALSGGVE